MKLLPAMWSSHCVSSWRFHYKTINRFVKLLVKQFPASQPPSWCQSESSFCTAWLVPWAFPIFSSHFIEFLSNLGHQDQWSNFLSVFEHCRASVSRFANSCFFSILSSFTNFGPYFWTYMIWSGSCLNLCPSSPKPHISFGRFSFNRVNFVNAFHESDALLFKSTFQQSPTRFSCMTSRSVWVDLVTSMFFSGIGNVSSFGT